VPAFHLRLPVPERGPRQPLRRPEPPGDLDRLEVDLLRLSVAARADLGRAQAEQQLGAQRLVRAGDLQRVERPPILGGGLLVCVGPHRAVAGPTRVGQRPGALAGAGDFGEVSAELGDVAVRVRAVELLNRLADRPVQAGPGRYRQGLVDHLAHQRVREAVAPQADRFLGHHAQGHGLGDRPEDPFGREIAGRPDQRQVELAAHHGGDREHLDGICRE
jgi:hypothetical protein